MQITMTQRVSPIMTRSRSRQQCPLRKRKHQEEDFERSINYYVLPAARETHHEDQEDTDVLFEKPSERPGSLVLLFFFFTICLLFFLFVQRIVGIGALVWESQ